MTNSVLITGNMGYIGPVLTRHLRDIYPDIYIIGYDAGFFGHCLTNAMAIPESRVDVQYFGDVRDISDEVFDSVGTVIQLAAISNDPMGSMFSDVTNDINCNAATDIARRAIRAGVRRIIYASSCSMYGYAEGGARNENDKLDPLTAYSKSKVAAEQGISLLNMGESVITCLRFSTACGVSDRLRLDLVLNDFVADAIFNGSINVLSDGSPWRPLIDVKDMCRAIEWAMIREEANGGQYLAINVGAAEWNFQIRDLADAVAKSIRGTKVYINSKAPPDRRSYRVDFSLFKKLAPSHQPQVELGQVISELKGKLESMNFADRNFRSSDLMRLKVLQRHVESGLLDANLRWVRS